MSFQFEPRLAKTDGNDVFMFFLLVTIEGVGLLQLFVVILKRGFSSASGSGLTRTFSTGALSIYGGNLARVEFSLPFLGGWDGLKGLS